jgi:hypothetical protein
MGDPMHYTEFERRKYPRVNAQIPIDIGLINRKKQRATQAQFKGITGDISMEGLSIELKHPGPEMLPFATRMMGGNREFDIEFTGNLGAKDVRGVGEVRWTSIPYPGMLKMGVSLKEMTGSEREKWTNFVTNQKRAASRNPSCRSIQAKRSLTKSLHRFAQNLLLSRFSMNCVFPALFIGISFITYWFVEITFYHLPIPLGIGIIVVLLTKSRIFSGKHVRSVMGLESLSHQNPRRSNGSTPSEGDER